MEYRSTTTLLGLPLIHVCTGTTRPPGVYQRRTARGWVAIGDSAVGVLFAAGGIACGGIAIGGCAGGGVAIGGVSAGVISVAGLAIGGYAVGGLAVGMIAVGGAALAWHAAFGGAAIAMKYAVGGLAIAEHANDPAARTIMSSQLMRVGTFAIEQSRWLMMLALLPLLSPVLFAVKRWRESTRRV